MQLPKNGRNKIFLILFLVGTFLAIQAKAQGILLVDVTIPEGYQHLIPGDSVLVETQIILVGRDQMEPVIDVLIEYTIKDKNNNIVTKLSETKGGIVRIQTIKELHLPADLLPGIYTLTAKASYKNVSAETSSSFELFKNYAEPVLPLPTTTNNLLIAVIIAVVSLFFFSAYQFWRIKKLLP